MERSCFHYMVVVSLLTLIAFAVRAVSLDTQSLWRDEVDALCYAFEFPHSIAQILAPEAVGGVSAPCACPPISPGFAPSHASVPRRLAQALGGMLRHNGPFYFFLLRGWVALTGTSEYAMRFLSLAFGVICVPLIYALGCRLSDGRAGFVAALLAATSPYLTWYGQEVKMYTLVPALATLALYGLRRAIEGGGWYWWAVQVVATALSFYSHVLAALLIPIQMLIYFVWWPQARRRWASALVSLACLTLPYLPLVAWQAPLTLQARETGFYPYTLGEMVEILLKGWSLGISGQGWPWGVVLMGGLAVWGLVSSPLSSLSGLSGLSGTRGVRNRLALVWWLATPLLIVWLISLRQPLFTDRYFVWSAPAFYLLIGLGLASLGRLEGWGRWTAASLAGAVFIFNGVNLWGQATTAVKSDFRAAAAYVADYRPAEGITSSQTVGERYDFECYLPLIAVNRCPFGELIVFQIPHGRYTFDYYFSEDKYPWADGVYTNHRTPDGSYLVSEEMAAHEMQEMTAVYDVVWLVATEAGMWDERGLVQAWLEAHMRRTAEAHFMRVDVYRYVR